MKFSRIITICMASLLTHLAANAQTEYIVTINPNTGILTKIDSIPGVRWLQSYSTYNQTTKEYTVMGLWQPGQSPVYLYTINSTNGHIISKPSLSNPNNIISLQYSRLTGKLYAILHQNNIYYLSTIDKATGIFTIIKDIQNISAVSAFTIDEANQRVFLRAVSPNTSYTLWTIDLLTGNVIYQAPTQGIAELRYDNGAQKLYGLLGRPGPTPGSFGITSICIVDPSTGIVTNVADLPGVTNIVAGDHGSFNENDHVFYFVGLERTPPVYLYSVDAVTGNIINKKAISTSGQITGDNLVFFRYDNLSNKMFALFWEAKTIGNPPTLVDSACRLDTLTRVYPNPFKKSFFVDKKITECKIKLIIYNSAGQVIKQLEKVNDGLSEISLSGMASGFYFYHFTSGGKILLSGRLLKGN